MRLLYVDDDRINALLFTQTCRLAEGLDVVTAGSGSEALEAVAGQRPDVLVIDMHLPDIDGLALLAALRKRDGLATTPAFLCSADDDPALQRSAIAAGFRRCWSKPVDLRSILSDLADLGPQGDPTRG